MTIDIKTCKIISLLIKTLQLNLLLNDTLYMHVYMYMYVSVKYFPGTDTELKATLVSHNSAARERDTNFPRNILASTRKRHGGPLRVHVYIKSSRRQLYEATPCNYLWASNDRAPGKSQPIFQSVLRAKGELSRHSLNPRRHRPDISVLASTGIFLHLTRSLINLIKALCFDFYS